MFEFDPIEMMYSCIYLALKVEDYNYDLGTFCAKVKNPGKCNPESKCILYCIWCIELLYRDSNVGSITGELYEILVASCDSSSILQQSDRNYY